MYASPQFALSSAAKVSSVGMLVCNHSITPVVKSQNEKPNRTCSPNAAVIRNKSLKQRPEVVVAQSNEIMLLVAKSHSCKRQIKIKYK